MLLVLDGVPRWDLLMLLQRSLSTRFVLLATMRTQRVPVEVHERTDDVVVSESDTHAHTTLRDTNLFLPGACFGAGPVR